MSAPVIQLQHLATEAAAADLFYSNLMNKVPTFFTQYTHPYLNSKYIFNRDGFAAASYKTGKKQAEQQQGTVDEDVEDSENEDMGLVTDDDEEEEGTGEANALFSTNANNFEQTMNDEDDVGFGAPKAYADMDTLKQRLLEKSKTLMAQPKLSKEEIVSRKAKRAEKDRIAKEKGIKQKSKPSGGHTTNADAQEAEHQNKKAKHAASDANQEVQLNNLEFAPIIQNHVSKSVELAGTKHVVGKKGTTKQRLAELEKFEGHVKALREAGQEDRAQELVQKKSVQTALQRAMGENVNDSIKSLKKHVKIAEKQKQKSTKAWKQRVAQQEKDLNARLDDRNLHIRKKIEHKKNKRLGKRQ